MKFELVIGTVLLTCVCFGQKADSFDMHVADYRLLLSKRIQAEVGITTSQRAALNKLADGERAQVLPYIQTFRKTHDNPQDLQTDKTYVGYLNAFREKILAQLKPAQLKRLRELSLQSVDLGGVLDVVVSTRIGMSAQQLKKVRDIYANGVKQSQAIIVEVNRKIISQYNRTKVKTEAEAKALNESIEKQRTEGLKQRDPEMKKIEAETKRQIQAVLTAKQLAAYRALEGKPFSPK